MEANQIQVSIVPMALSDGRTDYYVQIAIVDDAGNMVRAVTPHVFREEFKAAYHVALYDWLLNGRGEKPDVVDFNPEDWPARVMPASDGLDAAQSNDLEIKRLRDLVGKLIHPGSTYGLAIEKVIKRLECRPVSVAQAAPEPDWRELLMLVASRLELPRSESGPPDLPEHYERAIDQLEQLHTDEYERRLASEAKLWAAEAELGRLRKGGANKDQLFAEIFAIAEAWKGANGGIYTIRAMCLELLEKVLLPRLASRPPAAPVVPDDVLTALGVATTNTRVEPQRRWEAAEKVRKFLSSLTSAVPVETDGDIASTARFLIDRLEDFEREIGDGDEEREWAGHVHPAMSRLKSALGSPPRSSADRAELFQRIDARLADLREASEVYRKASWDRSSDIHRNDREIHWLKEFKALIPVEPQSSSDLDDLKSDYLRRHNDACDYWMALKLIVDGYGPNHGSKYCRDTAQAAIDEAHRRTSPLSRPEKA